MLAPNHVSAPAAIHTSSMPLNDGTALLTSDGCTKIDDPTMVPTTMAVAWVSPIVLVSLAGTARIVSGVRGPVSEARSQRFYLRGSTSEVARRGKRPNCGDSVGFRRALVGPIALHPREPERDATWI